MPRPTVALTDLEYRVLRYLERSREVGRVYVTVRTLAEVAGESVQRMSGLLRRLASFGLVVPDYSTLGTRYATSELGRRQLDSHHQVALEVPA
jgi:DNA-binding MarR family transcriptional regulator